MNNGIRFSVKKAQASSKVNFKREGARVVAGKLVECCLTKRQNAFTEFEVSLPGFVG